MEPILPENPISQKFKNDLVNFYCLLTCVGSFIVILLILHIIVCIREQKQMREYRLDIENGYQSNIHGSKK